MNPPTSNEISRREMSLLLPAMLGIFASQADAQTPLLPLAPGKYIQQPTHSAPNAPRQSRSFLLGMLPDNIRLEAHFTHLAPGCPPEPIEHHKHTEMWCVHEGAVTLLAAGKTQILHAGDFGLVPAGTEHSIYNASTTEPASYFVVAVGPPE